MATYHSRLSISSSLALFLFLGIVAGISHPSTAQAQVMTGGGYSVVPHILPVNGSTSGGGYTNQAAGQPLSGVLQGGNYQINSVLAIPAPASGGSVAGTIFVGGVVPSPSPSPSASTSPRPSVFPSPDNTPIASASPASSAQPTASPESRGFNDIGSGLKIPGIHDTLDRNSRQVDDDSDPGDTSDTSDTSDSSNTSDSSMNTDNAGSMSPSPSSSPRPTTSAYPGRTGSGSMIIDQPLDLVALRNLSCHPIWLLLLLILSFVNFLVLYIRREKIKRLSLYGGIAVLVLLISSWELWVCTWYYLAPLAIGLITLWESKREMDWRKKQEEAVRASAETQSTPNVPIPPTQ